MGRMSDQHIEEQENMTEEQALAQELEENSRRYEGPEEQED